MRNIWRRILEKINSRGEAENNPYFVFGIFGTITYPLYYIIWKYANLQGYENIGLRLAATFFCFLLLCRNKWPERFRKYFACYWYFTIFYCLPFLFTFLILKNNFSIPETLNTMTILVLCILLLDLISLIIILPLGIFFGWLLYYSIDGFPHLPSNYLII